MQEEIAGGVSGNRQLREAKDLHLLIHSSSDECLDPINIVEAVSNAHKGSGSSHLDVSVFHNLM